MINKPELLRYLRKQFRLDWHGIHGAAHWARVRLNGVTMARANGARAADFVAGLNGAYFQLDALGLDMLVHACRHHSDGMTEADLTIQTCWDSDRLDLARVGIWPDPQRLCTAAAREPSFMELAIDRSLGRAPDLRVDD